MNERSYRVHERITAMHHILVEVGLMLMQLDISTWLTRIEAEYREMPGLQLTGRQMQRLWGLDRQTCEVIVEVLVNRGVLCETSRHVFVLAERRFDPDVRTISRTVRE